MERAKRQFLFNIEWAEILSELSREVKYEVYDAIIEYVASGTVPDLKPAAKGAFLFIKRDIDYNENQYQKTVEARREAGSKGGKAKQNKQTVANQANATFAKQSQAKPSKTSHIDTDIDIVEDKSSAPYIPQGDVATAEENLEKKIEEYKNHKPIWKDGMCKKHKMSSDEIDRYLDQFYLDMECREYNVRNLPALFDSWLTNKRNGTDQQKQNVFPSGGKAGFRSKLPPEPGCGLIDD